MSEVMSGVLYVHVCIVCFFVYKQKTAYEIRISDWSSTCALPISPASKENDDRLEAKVDELIRITGRDRADALIEEIDRRYLRKAGHAKPHGHDDQIGRASCRERVCPYV